MVERLSGDQDAQIAHIGEVGQAEPARFVSLAENHLLLGSIYRPPGADAPFHGPSNARVKIGVPAAHLLEDRHHPQSRRRLEERYDLAVENIGQRVRPPAFARHATLRGQRRIQGNPIARRRAEPRLRGRSRNAIGLSKPHK
jgi:hypothetical protein